MSNETTDERRWGKIVAWIAAVGGSLTVLMLGWIGSSLISLKVTMAKMEDRSEQWPVQVQGQAIKMDRIEATVNDINTRLTKIETRQEKALR